MLGADRLGRTRRLPGQAAWDWSRWSSSCCAASRDSARVLNSVSSAMAVSRSASRCLSIWISSLSRVTWASRGSATWPAALGEALLEVAFQVGVSAVEGGAGDPGGAGECLDVAPAAGRHVAAQEPVGGSADAGLGLLALLPGQRHVSPSWWRRSRSAGARASCGCVRAGGGSFRRGGWGRGRRGMSRTGQRRHSTAAISPGRYG